MEGLAGTSSSSIRKEGPDIETLYNPKKARASAAVALGLPGTVAGTVPRAPEFLRNIDGELPGALGAGMSIPQKITRPEARHFVKKQEEAQVETRWDTEVLQEECLDESFDVVKEHGALKGSRRHDEPLVQDYTLGSVATIKELEHDPERLAQAVGEFDDAKTARSSRGTMESRLKWWRMRAEAGGFQP